mmetsp:Transcript_7733/g.14563  ORF Transcript_7733/g.14563 Transcript_7733/m.14563 type:complete len:212 (+) Transcript_7733:1939-2574(+)
MQGRPGERRRRVPAVGHLRVPGGPDAAHGGGEGPRGGHARLRSGDGAAEGDVARGSASGRLGDRAPHGGGGDGSARSDGSAPDNRLPQVHLEHSAVHARKSHPHRAGLRAVHAGPGGGRGCGVRAGGDSVLRGAGRADPRHGSSGDERGRRAGGGGQGGRRVRAAHRRRLGRGSVRRRHGNCLGGLRAAIAHRPEPHVHARPEPRSALAPG